MRPCVASFLLLSSALTGCASKGDPGTGTGNNNGGGGSNDGVHLTGSVTGLLGFGLTMKTSGAVDQKPAPIAPGFDFGLPPKTAYNITITAQPTNPWQTCTVTNGTGTANTSNTSVKVDCVTNTYAIKGNIIGLTGSGLVVQLSAGVTLPIVAGTPTFAFNSVPSGTVFALTIVAQPTGQTCLVNTGNGTLGGADVTNIAVTCTTPGFTVGGNAVSVSGPGLTIRLNGGAPFPIPASASIQAYAFPTTLQTGDRYSVVVLDPPVNPLKTCVLSNAHGVIGTTNVTNLQVQCFPNAALDSYGGTFTVLLNGKPQFLTLWLNGIYSLATRIDDPTCTSSGNGIEYGSYRRATNGDFQIWLAWSDTNGDCGVWKPSYVIGNGPQGGTLQRSGNTLNLNLPDTGPLTLQAVESNPASLVGAFTRADGTDGSFVVFQADGTYLYVDPQNSGSLGGTQGYERGCYTVTGATFTVSLASACRPNGFPALDGNGTNGFSSKNGAAIAFTITSATTATIDGVLYRRVVPEG